MITNRDYLGMRLLVAAVVGVAALTASLGASAAFRGEPGAIAFDFWEGQSMEIGVLNPDGSRTNLTNTTSMSEGTPRWSADGTRIVYMAHHDPFASSRLTDIWVMNADGSNKTQLTDTPLREEVPAWTADGRILFCGQSGDAGGWDIYLINADGSGRARLTNSPGLDCWPAPAPAGEKFSFTSERDGNLQIFTMKIDGTHLRQVTDTDAHSWGSDWSPSGNEITFVRDNVTEPYDTDVWMIRSNGTRERRLTHDGGERPEAFPSWSPDGTKIVFGRVVASGVFNVFSVDPVTGAEQTVITDDPPNSWSVAYPAWQPLGQNAGGVPVNLALGKPVTASSEYSGNPPALAVDGDWFTYWSSGNFPPAWIEVDLGSAQRVDEIDLGITQLPDCPTVHRVSGRLRTSQPYELLREFSGPTVDQQVLQYVASKPQRSRFVRVETTSSCSWVGWREIEVFGPGA